jgi:hypothetical protein
MQEIGQPSKAVTVFLAAWLLAAVALASSGLLSQGELTLGVSIPCSVLVLLAAAFGVKPLREAMGAAPLWGFVLIHSFRVCASMVFVYTDNGVDPTWAFWVGGGDIVSAVTSVPIAVFACPPASRGRRYALWAWNLFGILVVLGGPLTGLGMLATEPARMAQMRRLPLLMMPAFFLPVMIFSHTVITWRLLQERETPPNHAGGTETA